MYSNNIKEDTLKGKIFVVSNCYPLFDDRYDYALRDRLIIFDWHNTVSDENSIYDLAEQLNSEENRSRIVTFFIRRASIHMKNSSLQLHSSYNYNPELALDNSEKIILDFFKNNLFCNDGSIAVNQRMSMGWPLVCRADIYYAYINYHLFVLNQTRTTLQNKRNFYKLLRNFLDSYTQVVETRYPNDIFYRGVVINNNLINFNFQMPQVGNFGKPKLLV